MSYRREREQFIARMSTEGLPYAATEKLLRCATTINRCAELACSSEAADRDRVPCPASLNPKGENNDPNYPCLCDHDLGGAHETVPRIRIADWRAEQRAIKAVPAGWTVITEGDPRGYTLRVVPPSYAERNAGRDRFDLDAIGVPAGDSGLRF